ncbi:ferredoxin-type protein NapF [Tropicimonas sp.]|uniref:ferredoxin-type protein NapF n=1 Tax=Tropicimonas sp. TaxID=2067044 RepID=UPI003A863B40
MRQCDGCGDCIGACPEGIIVRDTRDAGGRVRLDFARGACTFCEACIEACPTGALSGAGRETWTWVAQPQPNCLGLNAVFCRTCQDFCDHSALRFRPMPGGQARPQIDQNRCVGCGACVGCCPAGAITLVRFQPDLAEATA